MKTLPPINVQYWALIISATTMGETAGDLVSMSLNIGYGLSSVVLVTLFIITLMIELNTKVQNQLLYWTVIVLTSTAGTTMSDFMTRTLQFGYGFGALLMVAILAVILGAWHLGKSSAAFNAPLNKKSEFLYWAAILVSSTLGTALGDFIANGTELGFGGGTLLLAGLLVLVTLLASFTHVSKELCYWLAIIITHPVGATMGDFLTKPEGFNLGNVWSSALLLAVFASVVLINKLATNITQPSYLPINKQKGYIAMDNPKSNLKQTIKYSIIFLVVSNIVLFTVLACLGKVSGDPKTLVFVDFWGRFTVYSLWFIGYGLYRQYLDHRPVIKAIVIFIICFNIPLFLLLSYFEKLSIEPKDLVFIDFWGRLTVYSFWFMGYELYRKYLA